MVLPGPVAGAGLVERAAVGENEGADGGTQAGVVGVDDAVAVGVTDVGDGGVVSGQGALGTGDLDLPVGGVGEGVAVDAGAAVEDLDPGAVGGLPVGAPVLLDRQVRSAVAVGVADRAHARPR